MLPTPVQEGVDAVKKVKDAALAKLGGDEYNQLLEALVTESETWKAELDERTGKTPSKEPEAREEPGAEETSGD